MKIICRSCSAAVLAPFRKQKLRSGRWGQWHVHESQIWRCLNCNLVQIQESAMNQSAYESGDYRSRFSVTKAEPIWKLLPSSTLIDLENATIVDVGAAGGEFLKELKRPGLRLIGVEPEINAQAENVAGIEYFRNVEDCLQQKILADRVFSFNVVEHVNDPKTFLSHCFSLLKPGGELLLVTPNHQDFLMKIILKDFSRYFYRTAHLSYFDRDSLKVTAISAGILRPKVFSFHAYDLNNLLQWLREKKPEGSRNRHTSILNSFYCNFLGGLGYGSHLCLIARKENP